MQRVHWWLRIWEPALNRLVVNLSHSSLHARTILQWQSANYNDISINYNSKLHPNSQLANQKQCLRSWHPLISHPCDLIWLWNQTHLAKFGYGKQLAKKSDDSDVHTFFIHLKCLIGLTWGTVFWLNYVAIIWNKAQLNSRDMPSKHTTKIRLGTCINIRMVRCNGEKCPVTTKFIHYIVPALNM